MGLTSGDAAKTVKGSGLVHEGSHSIGANTSETKMKQTPEMTSVAAAHCLALQPPTSTQQITNPFIVSLSTHPPICHPLTHHISIIYPLTHLSVYPSNNASIASFHLLIYPSTCPSVHPSMYLSSHILTYPSTYTPCGWTTQPFPYVSSVSSPEEILTGGRDGDHCF